MRNHRLFVLLVVFAAGLGFCAHLPNAQAASTVAQSFNVTASGATSALSYSGQLQCEAQVNQPVGSFQAIPQVSTDGTTWVTATWIKNGLIGQSGVFIGTNPVSPSYVFLRLFFSSISGPSISGQLACGDSLPPTNSGGTGAVSSVTGGANINVSPTTGDTVVSYTGPTPVPLTVSTPLVLTTPGGNSINIACPSCGGGGGGNPVVLASPTALPSPQSGQVAFTGPLYLGTGVSGTQGLNFINFPASAQCSGGWASIGADSSQSVSQVSAQAFGVNCPGNGLMLAIDHNGNVGVGSTLTAYDVRAQRFSNACPTGLPGGGALYSCGYTFNNDVGAVILGTAGTAGVDYCVLEFNSGVYGPGCTVNLSNSTKNVGEVTCTVASGTSCTQTATVRSGARCTATMETADSTLAGPYYAPSVDTSSTTLTVTMTAFTLGSGNLAANYWCP